jgi:WD40 repeat protein
MKNKSNGLSVFSHAVLAILVAVALQLPVIGYCNSASRWINNSLKSKGKKMKEVAARVADLHEDENIPIWGLAFSADGKHLAATSPTSSEVQIWNWQDRRIVQTLKKHGADLITTEPIRYSPNGHLLAWCGGVVVKVWNTKTWELIHTIDGTSGMTAAGGGCYATGFTLDGKSLVGIFDRNPTKPGDNLIVYDTTSWRPVWGLRTVPFYPKTLAISPDGKFVAVGGEVLNPKRWPFNGQPMAPRPVFGDPPLPDQSAIVVVDLRQRTIVRTIHNYAGHLAWSPDGAYITAAGGGGVKVFDVHSGKQVADEPLKSAHMVVRYTPDGKYLLESDMDALGNGLGVRIWDGQHRELLQVIPGNVGSLAVSRDGRYFAMGEYKKVIVWKLK